MEHLRSPQFIDADGEPTNSARAGLLYGSGVPRWRGYVFWSVIAVVGLVLIFTGEGALTNLLTLAGILFVAVALVAVLGVWRGRPLIRRF